MEFVHYNINTINLYLINKELKEAIVITLRISKAEETIQWINNISRTKLEIIKNDIENRVKRDTESKIRRLCFIVHKNNHELPYFQKKIENIKDKEEIDKQEEIENACLKYEEENAKKLKELQLNINLWKEKLEKIRSNKGPEFFHMMKQVIREYHKLLRDQKRNPIGSNFSPYNFTPISNQLIDNLLPNGLRIACFHNADIQTRGLFGQTRKRRRFNLYSCFLNRSCNLRNSTRRTNPIASEKKRNRSTRLSRSDHIQKLNDLVIEELNLQYGELLISILQELSNTNESIYDALYAEIYHWHSGKPFQENSKDKTPKDIMATFFEKYSQSLNLSEEPEKFKEFSQNLFTEVKILKQNEKEQREQIIIDNATNQETRHKTSPSKKQHQKGNQKVVSKSPASIKESYEINLKNWALSNNENELMKATFKIIEDSRFTDYKSKKECLLNGLFYLLRRQIQNCNLATEFNIDVAISIFMTANDILTNFEELLSQKQSAYISHTLETLFGKNTTQYRGDWKILQPLGKKLNVSEQIFQLKYCPTLILKDMNPQSFKHPDVRFHPDKWQYDLLNLINEDQSALVVAPTSAGKTFISFYTISRILEKNKDVCKSGKFGQMRSHVVFVAPSQVLANQMAANIYYRYKRISANFGIFTSDYRYNHEECDILICTPEILHILLLSPHCEQWAKELQYAIFDEIHCIATGDVIGKAYTQCLSLIQCPFLALSATISEPSKFKDWLSNVHDRKIHLIPNNIDNEPLQRWTDLKKHYFLPSNEEFVNVSTKPKTDCIINFHPFALLDLGNTMKEVDLNLINLSGDECCDLYFAILSVLTENKMNSEINEFNQYSPNVKLSNRIFKKDTMVYQSTLKSYFAKLSDDLKLQVIRKLQVALPSREKDLNNKEYIMENFLSLIVNLKHKNMLPAICFYLHINGIEQLLERIIVEIEKKEPERVDVNVPVKKKQKLWSADEQLDINGEEIDMYRNTKEESKRIKEEMLSTKIDNLKIAASKIHPDYSFTENFFENSDMRWWLERLLLKTDWSYNHIFLRALMRGIAIYHSSLPKPYRDLVETMFRAGHIPVVISTSALALGVNMPCKSVVFVKDNNLFTPLLERQIEGRAGRRGIDNLGHTIFFGINQPRVKELLYSPLQSLESSPTIDINTVLKMMILYNGYENKDNAISFLKKLIKRPLSIDCDVNGDVREKQLGVLYAVQFLNDIKLLDNKARPIGLSGLVSHIAEIFPVNILIHYLLISGAFDTICASYELTTQFENFSDLLKCRRACREYIMEILTHLIPFKRKDPKITLKPLSGPILLSIRRYNNFVINFNVNFDRLIRQLGFNSTVSQKLSPVWDMNPNQELDSFVLQFYCTGTYKALLHSHHLTDAKAYEHIFQFNSLLKKISSALRFLVQDPDNHPLARAFKDLSKEFEDCYNKMEYRS